MSSNTGLSEYIHKGVDIAGAAVPPLLATTLGDPTAGVLSQLGVVLTKELSDYVLRQQSHREAERSAAVVIYAVREIENRLSLGQEIRNDDFFRIRIGSESSANTLFEGILTKAKQQFEERKIQAIGKFFSSVAFNAKISAEDACWYLSLIDSLNYRSLLILQAFNELPPNSWNSNSIKKVGEKNQVIYSQINEPRNLNLLSAHTTFAVDVSLTELGIQLVELLCLADELHYYGADVKAAVEPHI